MEAEEYRRVNKKRTGDTMLFNNTQYALRENPKKSLRLLSSSGSEINLDCGRDCYNNNTNRASSPRSVLGHNWKYQSKQERIEIGDCRNCGVRSMKSKHSNKNDNFLAAKSVFKSLSSARRKKRLKGNNYNSIFSKSLLNASLWFDSREELEDVFEAADSLLMLSESGGTSELDNSDRVKRRNICKEVDRGCSTVASNPNVAQISFKKKFDDESRIKTGDVSSVEMDKALKCDAEITRELNSVEQKADTLRLKRCFAPKVYNRRAASMQMVSEVVNGTEA